MRKMAFSMAILMLVMMFTGCGTSGQTTSSVSIASSAADTPADEPITLVLGHTNAETDSRHAMVLKFAELVEEKTNGMVKIKCYGSGELGNGQEEIEGLGIGTQDILVEGYALLGMYSEYGMDSFPYLYRDYDHFMKCWYDSDVGDMWIKYAADAGFTVFGPSYRGFRNVTSMKSFDNAAGVAGLKIRTPGSEPFVSTWSYLGAQATPMDLAEVITGLQQGTVEAQENPLILSYNYGFADVCDYLIMTKHSCGADVFIMNTDRFNKLDPAYQTAILEAAEEAAKEIIAANFEEEDSYIQKFAD